MVQCRPAPPPECGWVFSLPSNGSPPPGGGVFGMLVMGGMYVCLYVGRYVCMYVSMYLCM